MVLLSAGVIGIPKGRQRRESLGRLDDEFPQRQLISQLLASLPGCLLSRRLHPVVAASVVNHDLPLVPRDKANHPSGG